jgi:hypothetical protein
MVVITFVEEISDHEPAGAQFRKKPEGHFPSAPRFIILSIYKG